MITKETNDLSKIDFNAGEVILIDKGAGYTSFDVIRKLRRIIGIKKIGHAGTLDPFATGLLILCSGKKTKEIDRFQALNKKYSGIITLGKTTPSMDGETEFIEEKDVAHITNEQIETTRKLFLGKVTQIPPMYSAIKHKGKALYKYARKGIEISRQPREIFIEKFDIEKIDLPDVHFNMVCSKGTYVRVIANDFGEKLSCGGYLKSLRRDAIGDFKAANAFTLDEFERTYKASVNMV